ncbi:MAG: Glutamine-dependent NAD(+) synthetase [Myxococcota bacterium]|nr:Glutamine-dependent NAD(+) synthetase [Myxococcota bacterium]
MRIALAQINTTVGDVAGNLRRILEDYERARGMDADLVVFPECCLSGYPPLDLVDDPGFLDALETALLELTAAADNGPAMIVGCPTRNTDPAGKPLRNSVMLLDGGREIARRHKSLLPTYDVFDEYRWFESAAENQPIEWRGRRLGLAICEDYWNEQGFWDKRLYRRDPVSDLAAAGADLLISVGASPFWLNKQRLRERMFGHIARVHGLPLVAVNPTGANDGLIFDGRSAAFNASGDVVLRSPAWSEDLLLFDPDGGHPPLSPPPDEGPAELFAALVLGVRDYVHKCGFRQVLLGLSGGVDSALTAVIAAGALGPENVTGVLLPSRFNAPESSADAEALAANVGIRTLTLPIEPAFEAMLNTLAVPFRGLPPGVAEENLQSRIRGTLLMALSNKFSSLLLTTGNKSEIATGYCTLYGDMCGALAVIGDLYKTQAYDLARWINRECEVIPWNTITRAPSAELRFNQTDQDTLPDYPLLDGLLRCYLEGGQSARQIIAQGYDAALVHRVLRMVDINEYKRRQGAPVLKVSTKAFGPGRVRPIAQGWRHT